MRDEIQRIIKLVQEGKLSPEDAAELIDAFQGGEAPSEDAGPGEPPPPPPPPSAPKDPFRSLIDAIERSAKEATQGVNWQEVAKSTRENAQKGLEHLMQGLEKVTKGEFDLGGIFGTTQTKETTLPISVGEGKKLRIENPLGDVRVSTGFDRGTARASAKFRGGTAEELKAKADAYNLILEESDHEVVIRQPDVAGLHVDLDVQLSAGAEVDIRCESGDVLVLDTKAPARVNSRSGDVRLKGLTGLIEIVNASGDVAVEDSAGSLQIENKSGDLTIRRFSGTLSARTASGDVRLQEVSGKAVAVESVSGDVKVELEEPVTGTVSLRTVNGDTHLLVPDGSDCRVTLSTLRGDVHSSIELSEENRQPQRITGKLGEGSGTLDVSAVTGDISLELRPTAVATETA